MTTARGTGVHSGQNMRHATEARPKMEMEEPRRAATSPITYISIRLFKHVEKNVFATSNTSSSNIVKKMCFLRYFGRGLCEGPNPIRRGGWKLPPIHSIHLHI